MHKGCEIGLSPFAPLPSIRSHSRSFCETVTESNPNPIQVRYRTALRPEET